VLAAGLLIVAGGSYLGLLLGAGIGRSVAFPENWQLAACDIGQGDAVVVRDDDHYALVDVGPDAALLTDCLETLGIDRIDLLVLTHYDLDHVGGLDAVLGRVGTVLVGPPENSQDEHLHDRLIANGATVHVAGQGDLGTLGRLRWNVLWPKRGTSAMQTGNDGSVTIEFDGQGIRSLFLGDLGEDAQKALQSASTIGTVDVVKVAHHGSNDQDSALYARLHATVGLISVGVDNGYGHPTKDALDALRAAGTTVLRTDRQGLLVVAPAAPEARTAGSLTVWTEKVRGSPEQAGRALTSSR
jgi:competence protein ComEC